MTDPTSLPSFPPPGDEHPLRGRILDALIDEGFRPDLDKEGDVKVKVQGQQLFVRSVDAKPAKGQPANSQPAVMRVFGQWQIGTTVPADELTRLRAANQLTSRLNIVKVTVHDNLLLVTAEYLVFEGADLRRLLLSTFQGLLGAVQLWHKSAGGKPTAAGGEAPPAGAGAPPAEGQAAGGQAQGQADDAPGSGPADRPGHSGGQDAPDNRT